MPDPITLDTVRQTAREIARYHPARRNPAKDDGNILTCLYTGPDGSHCLAGEILTRLGLELPPEGKVVHPYFVGSGQFTPEALKYMYRLQIFADEDCRRWDEAYDLTEQWQKIQEWQDA